MQNYIYPTFNFSPPTDFIKRMDKIATPAQGYRSEFMRDRDRVMYCSSFRRLAGKTQIYLAGKDDNQRNRLTHTLEVSQIARTISHALNLDCDLTEAIALGHDLGHAPFGHAGEQILHEIMVPDSKITIVNSPFSKSEFWVSNEIKEPLYGFKHNVQSLRIAASTEDGYGNNGLNLTNYTLWGILHHSSVEYKQGKVDTKKTIPEYVETYTKHMAINKYPRKEAWSFEAFVVKQADEIAQWHHDIEDALRGNAMTVTYVCNTISEILNDIISKEHSKVLKQIGTQHRLNRKNITDLSRVVVDTLVNRLVECSKHNLDILWKKHVKCVSGKEKFFREHSWSEPEISSAIGFSKIDEDSESSSSLLSQYPRVINEKIHHSADVERMNVKGGYIIKKLFQAYYSHPQQLPDSIVLRYMIDAKVYRSLKEAEDEGVGAVRVAFDNLLKDKNKYDISKQILLMRKICDHVAGMTDRYAIEEYNNLYG